MTPDEHDLAARFKRLDRAQRGLKVAVAIIIAGLLALTAALGYSAALSSDRAHQAQQDRAALAAQVRRLGGKPVVDVPPGRPGAQGPAGIPGLIVNQVRGAFTADQQESSRAPTYTPDDRSIRLTLAGPADVKVTVWWQTSFVPPDPKSDSLLLLDEKLAGGDQAIPVPDHVPSKAAFASVQIDAATYAFSIATEK